MVFLVLGVYYVSPEFKEKKLIKKVSYLLCLIFGRVLSPAYLHTSGWTHELSQSVVGYAAIDPSWQPVNGENQEKVRHEFSRNLQIKIYL